MDLLPLEAAPVPAGMLSGPAGSSGRFSSTMPQDNSPSASRSGVSGLNGWPLALPVPFFGSLPVPGGAVGLSLLESTPMGRAVSSALLTAAGARPSSATSQTREALRFILSPEGNEGLQNTVRPLLLRMFQDLSMQLVTRNVQLRSVCPGLCHGILQAFHEIHGRSSLLSLLSFLLQARFSGSLSLMSWSSQWMHSAAHR